MASQSEYSSGGETHHSQPPSLRRQKETRAQHQPQRAEQLLNLKIVGPAKARVTKVTEEADQLLETGQTIADTLSKLTPNTEGRPETLKTADSFLLEAKRTVHNLCSLYNYVDVILKDISMNESPFKDRYLAEAYTLIAKANPHVLAKQLHEMIFSLEAQLKELGYPLTSYVPPEDDESEPIYAMEHDMKLTCENNRLSNEPLITPKLPSNPPDNLEQTRNILETEDEETSLKRQPEIQQKQAVLNEQNSSTKIFELKSRYSQHASILHEQQIRVETSGYSSETSVYPSRQPQNSDQIRAGIPTTESNDQIRAGIPTTQSLDHIRAGIPTTEANPNNLQNYEIESDHKKAMLETLRKIHEETMRSQSDLQAGIAELLARQRAQQDESYADEYEKAFAGAEDLYNGERQADSGPFSTSEYSYHSHSNIQPPQMYDGYPYERKLDPTKYLSPYDGTGDLEQFQYEFNTFVMQDEQFTIKDSFLILRNLLTGQAQQCLYYSRNSQEEEAIEKTFALLQRTFGNSQTQTSLLSRLVNLPFHQSDPQKMRQNLAAITTVLEQLYQTGIPANDSRTTNDIVRKLPPTMRQNLCEFMVAVGEQLTHNQVIDKIYSTIAVLDMDKTVLSYGYDHEWNEINDSFGEINLANASGTFKTGRKGTVNPRKSQAAGNGYPVETQKELPPLAYVKDGLPRRYIDPITGKALEGYYAPGTAGPDLRMFHRTFPFQAPEKTKCLVCEGDHNVIRCTLTSTAFRKMSKAKKLCPICANKHPIEECRSQNKCGYCGGIHHMGGCPQKEFYREPENYPKGAKAKAKIFCADITFQ